jgi:hypothetical protein
MISFRKTLSITALITIASVSAKAQGYYVDNENTFYGGPVVGLNFTQVDGDNYAGYSKVGFNLGGIVYAKFGSDFAASLEISYAQKGAAGKPKPSGVPGINLIDYTLKLNYAEIPVCVYYVDGHKNHFGAGLCYGRLISADEKVETNPTYNFNQENFPFKKSDLSFLLNINLHIWKGFFVNGRFSYSMIPIRTDVPFGLGRSGGGGAGNGQQFNNSMALRFVYVFGKF